MQESCWGHDTSNYISNGVALSLCAMLSLCSIKLTKLPRSFKCALAYMLGLPKTLMCFGGASRTGILQQNCRIEKINCTIGDCKFTLISY